MNQIEISKEPIELFKLLKLSGLASSGSDAKAIVAAGEVRVNGVIQTQKRKKIVSGDIVEFQNEKIQASLV